MPRPVEREHAAAVRAVARAAARSRARRARSSAGRARPAPRPRRRRRGGPRPPRPIAPWRSSAPSAARSIAMLSPFRSPDPLLVMNLSLTGDGSFTSGERQSSLIGEGHADDGRRARAPPRPAAARRPRGHPRPPGRGGRRAVQPQRLPPHRLEPHRARRGLRGGHLLQALRRQARSLPRRLRGLGHHRVGRDRTRAHGRALAAPRRPIGSWRSCCATTSAGAGCARRWPRCSPRTRRCAPSTARSGGASSTCCAPCARRPRARPAPSEEDALLLFTLERACDAIASGEADDLGLERERLLALIRDAIAGALAPR